MIKNERQLQITKEMVTKFEQAVDQLEHHPTPSDPTDPMMRQVQLAALNSQLHDLRTEVAEYEALGDGRVRRLKFGSFEEIGQAMIKARIAAGWTQRQLAERMGLKEQQIQRYEATEYESASLARLSEIVDALGVEVRYDVAFPTSTSNRGRSRTGRSDSGAENGGAHAAKRGQPVESRRVPGRRRLIPATAKRDEALAGS